MHKLYIFWFSRITIMSMSITSKATVFAGSEHFDDISWDDANLNDLSIADTPAILSVDGSTRSAMRSVSALSTRNDTHGHYVVVLNDSRGASGEVGIAAISTLTQKTLIIELSDTPRFTRTLRFLAIHEPCLVVCCDTVNSRLCSVLEETFKGTVPIQKQPRGWFSEREGRRAIEQYASSEQHESLLVTVDQRFYCLASLGALMHWIEDGGDQIKPKSLDICYSAGDEGVMIIDYHSCRLLELVKCVESGSRNQELKRCSLLAAVNTCKTAMGTRMLRCNLLQPLTGNQETSNSRCHHNQTTTRYRKHLTSH